MERRTVVAGGDQSALRRRIKANTTTASLSSTPRAARRAFKAEKGNWSRQQQSVVQTVSLKSGSHSESSCALSKECLGSGDDQQLGTTIRATKTDEGSDWWMSFGGSKGRSQCSLKRRRRSMLIQYYFGSSCYRWLLLVLALATCWRPFWLPLAYCDDSQDFQKNMFGLHSTIPAKLVWTAVNKSVELPCDISPPPRDTVKLVLWFKDTTGIPLYSFDSRGGSSKPATHSALAGDLGKRLFFSAGETPKEAHLRISDVRDTDGGVYRCRVDFFNSPTKNFRVNLTLVVPPEEPRIFDAQGKEVAGVAGPFREGFELFLSCQVAGGRPPPKVTWWRDNVEISSTSHASADQGAQAIVNQLFIGTVTRDFYGSKLECRAQGSKLVPAVTKEVTVQVHLKPLKVKIVTPNELLTAGRPVPLRCESWGSYPPAKIVWLLDGEPIRSSDITVHTDRDDGNLTSSILTLRVAAENDGAELTCRASNPWFSTGTLDDKRIVNVAYPPTASVHLANEDPSRVVTRSEGQNVTLKCRADARPPVTAFGWFKNGMRMSGENSETLHLTALERESGGMYACSALNTEGETKSSSLTLRVQFAPRCKPGTEQTSVGAINSQSISVKCEVDADPPDSVRFSWTYNNTRNVSPVLNSRIMTTGLVSAMTYLPQTDSELITLACWASNVVGRQVTPCLVHIIPARIPEPPRSCEMRNDTGLEVVCNAGGDGGLSQHFLLEVVGGLPIYSYDSTLQQPPVYPPLPGGGGVGQKSPVLEMEHNEISTMNDQATLAPLYRVEEQEPLFKLPNLEPGREYQFMIYSVNAKGRSDPPVILDKIRISNSILPYDETIISEDPTPAETSNQDKERQSALVVLAGVIAAGFVIVTSIIVAGIVAMCRHHRPKPPEPQEVRKRMRPARTDVPSMYAEDDGFEEEYTRSADIRQSRASLNRGSRYVTEGFVQYSQPSLNVYIADPDLILPRGDVEFTTLGGPLGIITTSGPGAGGGLGGLVGPGGGIIVSGEAIVAVGGTIPGPGAGGVGGA